MWPSPVSNGSISLSISLPLQEDGAVPLTVMLRYSALLGFPRARAAKALGISNNALGRVSHGLGIQWPRTNNNKTTKHRLIREGSGPRELVGRLIWKRSPVL